MYIVFSVESCKFRLRQSSNTATSSSDILVNNANSNLGSANVLLQSVSSSRKISNGNSVSTGMISGVGGVEISGDNTTFIGNNTYLGNTTLSGGILNAGSVNAFGNASSTIHFTGPVALFAKIFTHEEGSTGILYLVTNNLESSADRIYEIYQKRWRIEKYHKSIKQNASLEKSPTKVVRSQKNHIFASIVAYCKLEFLRTKTSLNHLALKYKLLIKANQMAFKELNKLFEKAEPE